MKVKLQKVQTDVAQKNGVHLHILRLDIIHPFISGNKWYKLKYNLETAFREGHDTVLSFGGAYSNHIHALATVANEKGLKSIGVIRGEPTLPLNPTLEYACKMGMKLHYISRGDFREKASGVFLDDLKKTFGPFYIIPEGGTNTLALKGASEIVDENVALYDYLCLPVGTGGTIGGVICGMQGRGTILGFPVLKGDFLPLEIAKLVMNHVNKSFSNWELINDFHFGGYAKFTSQLIDFINRFKSEQQIPLDPIYTGKMMFGVCSLIESGYFNKGSRILAIHTGGLQGIEGFNLRFGGLIE